MFDSIWILLLWIAALVMVVAPLIVAMATAIINGYFKAKKNYILQLIGATTKALGQTLEQNSEKLKEAFNSQIK